MKFLNLSLSYRLLLAIIPGFVLLLALVADVFIEGWYWDDERWILLWIAYDALFGVFVMAPFITSRSRLILRIGVLIAASILIPYAANLSYDWLETEYNAPLGAIFVILIELLLAAVLVIAAPLKVSQKYWIYVVLAALVTTAVLIFSGRYIFMCIPIILPVPCPWWHDIAVIIPTSVVAPLSFCTAVYFGRIDSKRVEQIATESERE